MFELKKGKQKNTKIELSRGLRKSAFIDYRPTTGDKSCRFVEIKQ